MLLKRHHLLVAAATLTLGLFGTAANAADIFSLTSATFKDSTMMPKNAANSTANAPTNPNCVGDNVSPQFSWTNVPDGTKSFVLLMVDPEGRGIQHPIYRGRSPVQEAALSGHMDIMSLLVDAGAFQAPASHGTVESVGFGGGKPTRLARGAEPTWTG